MVIKVCWPCASIRMWTAAGWEILSARTITYIYRFCLALPEGLIVPVIRFADQKTLSQIAADAKQLYAKTGIKKLQPNKFGNTFLHFQPGNDGSKKVHRHHQPTDSCILTVVEISGEIVIPQERAVWCYQCNESNPQLRPPAVLMAVGAAFLQTLKKYLENPVTMLVWSVHVN